MITLLCIRDRDRRVIDVEDVDSALRCIGPLAVIVLDSVGEAVYAEPVSVR